MSEPRLYTWLLGAWVVVALAVVPYLLLRPAPYGRHGRPGWGPVVNARLAWVLMELPSPLLMTVMFCLGDRRTNLSALAFLALWLGHYVYRTVAWSHDGTHVVFEQATGAQQPLPVIDGQGDIAYIDRDGYVQVVAAHGGKHELRAYPLSVDRDSSQNAGSSAFSSRPT